MIEFLLFLFGSAGFTITFMLGEIFEKPRNIISEFSEFLEKLIYCPMCLGFWTGFISSFVFSYNALYAGFTVALFSWAIFNIISLHISISNYIDEKLSE